MWWLYIVIVIAIILIIVLIFGAKRTISIERKAGIKGEKYVNNHLQQLLQKDERLLTGIILPYFNRIQNKQDTSEIDSILITHKGIFCIEIKNWAGHIIGTDESEYWIQIYGNPYKKDKQNNNPVKQNKGHCAVLKRILKEKLNNNYQVNNIVIMAKPLCLSEIESNYVFDVNNFIEYYKKLDDTKLNLSQIKTLYEILRHYVATPQELEKHREKMKKRFN